MKPRIQYLQHVPFEDPGYILTYAQKHTWPVACTRIYENDPFPALDSFDWLIVMGGPMSVYEESLYPWISDEKKCIRQAIDRGKIVIGICLGAQMIASVLGARVYPHIHKEIGWFPVTLTPQALSVPVLKGIPDIFMAYHWHGDTFDIPAGAVHCAQSSGCPNQSFVFDNRVVGLQFHLEATPSSIGNMVAACGAESTPATFVQDVPRMIEGCDYCPESNDVLTCLLDNLVIHTAQQ